MPIYEYRCPDCAEHFEELVGVAACEELRHCPQCGEQAHRVLSTFAVRVKGGSPSSAGKSCSGCRKSSCATC